MTFKVFFFHPPAHWPVPSFFSNSNEGPTAFHRHVQQSLKEVPEFVYLTKKAKEHGLKVWLFGGTASTFAHYAKNNPAVGEGEFLDIYLPLKILTLWPTEDSKIFKRFKKRLWPLFPRFEVTGKLGGQASQREQWRQEALLGNANFSNSTRTPHSVGAIALNPDEGQAVVRDLFDWDSQHPQFLKDVLAGRLHFYHSPHHRKTPRFKNGINPEIFVVIRYLIKLFQHELEMAPGDLEKIKKIIAEFDPQSVSKNYVRAWLNYNVPKLFLQAKDMEFAWNTLEDVGLRQKLFKVGSVKKEKSLAWWMDKRPLRGFDMGQGTGKTAKELGLKNVYHTTDDFLTWSMITQSKKGKANVFKSKELPVGESAAMGDGLYTTPKEPDLPGSFDMEFAHRPKGQRGK